MTVRNARGQQHTAAAATTTQTQPTAQATAAAAAAKKNEEMASELQRLRAKEAFGSAVVGWNKQIVEKAGKMFFHIRQFITCQADEEFGSIWQRMHTDMLGVPPEQCREYWNKPVVGGKVVARKTLNTKKANVTGMIKRQFEGKQVCCHC